MLYLKYITILAFAGSILFCYSVTNSFAQEKKEKEKVRVSPKALIIQPSRC